jgi:hypothetical protein
LSAAGTHTLSVLVVHAHSPDHDARPPRLSVEPSWPDPYTTLALEPGFSITDVHDATARVQALIDALAAARP